VADFAEIVFEWGVDYGAVGGPSFNNTTIETLSGWSQTNVNWDTPLGRWQLGNRTLDEQSWDYLRNFFHARQGDAQPFRYLDWSDYEFKDEVIAIANGTQTVFPAYRVYGDAYGQTKRRIYKLDKRLRVNPLPQSIDFNLGTITYATAPTSGTEIKLNGVFYTPARFEQKNLEVRFNAKSDWDGERLFDLGTLSVVEVRP
jgi:uncharacterized protein (TIGR02217 family)